MKVLPWPTLVVVRVACARLWKAVDYEAEDDARAALRECGLGLDGR